MEVGETTARSRPCLLPFVRLLESQLRSTRDGSPGWASTEGLQPTARSARGGQWQRPAETFGSGSPAGGRGLAVLGGGCRPRRGDGAWGCGNGGLEGSGVRLWGAQRGEGEEKMVSCVRAGAAAWRRAAIVRQLLYTRRHAWG